MKKVTQTDKTPHIDWLFGGNPDAIYRQESEGQKELVSSCQMPAYLNSDIGKNSAIPEYAKVGIKPIEGAESHDEYFIEVTMPEGWAKQVTNHSMCSNLVDDKGRVRAMMFYKAAFYDRSAFIRFETRYRVTHEHLDGEERNGFGPRKAVVKDGNKIIWESEVYYGWGSTPGKDENYETAKAWADEHFPDRQNPHAYWD